MVLVNTKDSRKTLLIAGAIFDSRMKEESHTGLRDVRCYQKSPESNVMSLTAKMAISAPTESKLHNLTWTPLYGTCGGLSMLTQVSCLPLALDTWDVSPNKGLYLQKFIPEGPSNEFTISVVRKESY